MTQITREEAFYAIATERAYQDAAAGNAKRHPEDPPSMTIGEHILWMEECLLQARQAAYKTEGVKDALGHLRKVCALGVRCMEFYGAYPRRDASGRAYTVE